MSFVSTGFTSRRLPISYCLSTYSFMFLWLKFFIRNNKLLFLDDVINGRTVDNSSVKGWKWRYEYTFHVRISRFRYLKICMRLPIKYSSLALKNCRLYLYSWWWWCCAMNSYDWRCSCSSSSYMWATIGGLCGEGCCSRCPWISWLVNIYLCFFFQIEIHCWWSSTQFVSLCPLMSIWWSLSRLCSEFDMSWQSTNWRMTLSVYYHNTTEKQNKATQVVHILESLYGCFCRNDSNLL